MRKLLRSVIVLTLILAAVCVFCVGASAADEGQWITAWSTRITELALENYDHITVSVGDITARTVLTPSASGSKIRIRFSNLYGDEEMVIKSATVAKSTGMSSVDTGTFVNLTFSGEKGVVIPAGGEVYCDEVDFKVTAGEDIAVSLYIKEFAEIKSAGLSGATTYIPTGKGDKTRAEDLNILSNGEVSDVIKDALNTLFGYIVADGFLEIKLSGSLIKVVPILSDVEVLNHNSDAYSVVVIGDSTVANDFPTYLAGVINETGITDIGVAGKGIIGNQLLRDGMGYGSLLFNKSLLSRMERDILGADGLNSTNVKYVIVKIGANDIIHPVCKEALEKGEKQPDAEDIIEGYKEVFDFCHDNGIKVIAASITQWKGTARDYFGTGAQYDRTAEEFEADWQIAKDVNAWLSTTAVREGYCDGYIDYVDISKNPDDVDAFLPDYTTDGIHPTSKLQKVWAESFPINLIGATKRAGGVTLSPSSVTVYRGSSTTLTAAVTPSDAPDKTVIWESSDPSVATVDSKGKVTAKKAGTCVITVKTADKGYSGVGYSAKCTVTVRVKPESISVKGENTLYTTKTTQLTATVLPADASDKRITWSSSDEEVATVDGNGLVKAVGSGTAVITVSSVEMPSVKGTFTVTVRKKIAVQSVNLNISEKTKYKGTTLALKATIYPADASFPELKWTSSDSEVASVDSSGNVRALKAGKAVITCTSVDNPLCKSTCVVTVKVKTTGVKLSKSKLTMHTAQTKTLKATVLPSDATNKNVKYTSSNKKVATVSSEGVITAKKAGTCTITVKTKSGGFVAKCKIKVKNYVAVKSFKLNKKSVSVSDGKTYKLKATFSPSNASDKSVVWSSSNPKIATVSSKGIVTGVKPGTCTITCKSKDTGKKVTCKVKVKRVYVSSVQFEESVYTVNCNEKITLKAKISPKNATTQKVYWESSNPEYATVSSKGKVTGLVGGKTVTITATTKDGEHIAKCKVKVINIPLKGMKLNKSKATTGVGGSVTLTPVFTPSNASEQTVSWTTSDKTIATVSSKGVVTPLKDGTCIISCVAKDGGYVSSCTITVKTVKATGITLDQSILYVDNGGQFTLKATVLPDNATNKKVTWSSTKTSVCTVTSAGVVTAVGVGTCNIKATTANGTLVATCKVTVVE